MTKDQGITLRLLIRLGQVMLTLAINKNMESGITEVVVVHQLEKQLSELLLVVLQKNTLGKSLVYKFVAI